MKTFFLSVWVAVDFQWRWIDCFQISSFLRKQGFQTSRFAGKQGFWNSKALGISGGKGSFPDSDPSTCFSDLQQGHVYIYHRIKAVGFRSATWSVSFRRTWFQNSSSPMCINQIVVISNAKHPRNNQKHSVPFQTHISKLCRLVIALCSVSILVFRYLDHPCFLRRDRDIEKRTRSRKNAKLQTVWANDKVSLCWVAVDFQWRF